MVDAKDLAKYPYKIRLLQEDGTRKVVVFDNVEDWKFNCKAIEGSCKLAFSDGFKAGAKYGIKKALPWIALGAGIGVGIGVIAKVAIDKKKEQEDKEWES